MRKTLTAILLCSITLPAISSTKCIQTPISCTFREPQGSSWGSEWYARCNTATIKGVASCSNKSGTTGDFVDNITFSSDTSQNKYCWCRIIIPIVTYWYYPAYNTFMQYTASQCAEKCSNACSNSAGADGNYSAVLQAYFSHIMN